MIERLIENWLDSASERAFQVPYCQSLLAEGFTVVHLSRHCAMELGKDILAIDKNGIPCAFQLKSVKGERVTLSKYRADVEPQLVSLALGNIVHPTIDSAIPHKSYLVINGDLTEEVARAIDDFNRARIADGTNRTIEVIVKGQLLQKFKDLGSDFWPFNPMQVQLMLELYLSNPKGFLPKEKFHDFLKSCLINTIPDNPTSDDFRRSVIATSILSSYIIGRFVEEKNNYAEFEMWLMFSAYFLSVVEHWGIPEPSWRDIYDLSFQNMINASLRIVDELRSRNNYVEGDAFTDHEAYKIRMTLLLGIVSIVGIWNRKQDTIDVDLDSFAREFIKANKTNLLLWGEYAIPQFLSYYYYQNLTDATYVPDFLLLSVIDGIVKQNRSKKEFGIPNPYYDSEKIMPHLLGLSEEKFEDSFAGSSHSLEAILHLSVRTNWKQHIKLSWPEITKITISEFIPENQFEYYLWRCEKGVNKTKLIPHTKAWDDLKEEAFEERGSELPDIIKQNPIYLLCFLLVNPHRLTSNVTRWLGSNLSKN